MGPMGAAGEVAKELGLPVAAPVVRLALLGKGDEEPLVYYESFFPPEIGQKMTREARKREEAGVPFSTYDLYGESSGVFPATVNQTFEAIIASEPLSAIMEVKKGSSLLLIQSLFLNRDRQPLEFRKALYRGDRYKFHIVRDFTLYQDMAALQYSAEKAL
jgi:GntR family transcriptional regulator